MERNKKIAWKKKKILESEENKDKWEFEDEEEEARDWIMEDLGSEFEVIECVDKKWLVILKIFQLKYSQISKLLRIVTWSTRGILP